MKSLVQLCLLYTNTCTRRSSRMAQSDSRTAIGTIATTALLTLDVAIDAPADAKATANAIAGPVQLDCNNFVQGD